MAERVYDGTTVFVERDEDYDPDVIRLGFMGGETLVRLTAQGAREVARDLLEHAERLDPPKVRITVYDAPPREPDPGFGPGHIAAAYERGRRQGRYEAGG